MFISINFELANVQIQFSLLFSSLNLKAFEWRQWEVLYLLAINLTLCCSCLREMYSLFLVNDGV